MNLKSFGTMKIAMPAIKEIKGASSKLIVMTVLLLKVTYLSSLDRILTRRIDYDALTI